MKMAQLHFMGFLEKWMSSFSSKGMQMVDFSILTKFYEISINAFSFRIQQKSNTPLSLEIRCYNPEKSILLEKWAAIRSISDWLWIFLTPKLIGNPVKSLFLRSSQGSNFMEHLLRGNFSWKPQPSLAKTKNIKKGGEAELTDWWTALSGFGQKLWETNTEVLSKTHMWWAWVSSSSMTS